MTSRGRNWEPGLRRKPEGEETRPFKVFFRVSYSEREAIREKVIESGLDMADWLRQQVKRALTAGR
jgi:hypothetical protein